MLYFRNSNPEMVMHLLDGVNQANIEHVRDILVEHGLHFASVKKMENGGLEIMQDYDYLLLGPLGGIEKARGKWQKYDCFERDLDEFDAMLENSVGAILEGTIDVVNLG